MKLLQKLFFGLIVASSLISVSAAAADNYPNKPIKFIIPSPAAGPVDAAGRAIAAELKEIFNQPIVIENRAGATGMVAASMIANSAPDGYTMGLVWSSLPSSLVFNQRLSFTSRDLVGVSLISTIGFGLVARNDRPYNNFKELIEYAKKNPGKVSIGTSGTGGMGHLAILMIEQQTGAKFLHVPYNGLQNAMLAALAGDIDIFTSEPGRAQQFIDQNKLKYLVNISEKHKFIEPKYKNFESVGDHYPSVKGFETWVGVVVPSGTPREIVEKINKAITTGAKTERYQTTVLKAGLKPLWTTVEEFNNLILTDLGRMHFIRQQSGLRID